MSVYQIEFDFGVPQFRLVFQPMLIAAAAAMGTIVARITLGRGAAIIAALFAIALRGGGRPDSGTRVGRRDQLVPALSRTGAGGRTGGAHPTVPPADPVRGGFGLGIGTVGLWLESLWIAKVYHYPWPTSLWREALPTAVPVAILVGICAAMLGMVLTSQRLPGRGIGITAVALTVLVIGGTVANGLHIHVPSQDTATVKLTDLPSAPGQRMVSADVQINPPGAISDHPDWLTVLAWQGKMDNERGLVIDRLTKVGPGHYVSNRPLPVWGSWKTLVRIHDGRTLAAVPIWAPADEAIPVKEIPVQLNSTRPFTFEVSILQRERDPGVPSWLFTAGGVVVLFFTLCVVSALTWGAGRINEDDTAPTQPEEPALDRVPPKAA